MRVWILSLAGLSISPAFAASFAPGLAHTSVYFDASHFDRSTMHSRFGKINGVINFDETTHQGGFDFTVDVNSISTHLCVLDSVLGPEQLLDAAKFPVICLRSDRFVVGGGRLIAIEANLTLRGMTQPVWLEVRRFSCGDEKMPGSTRHVCGGDLHLAIARSTFDMIRFPPDVGDCVNLGIGVEVIPQ